MTARRLTVGKIRKAIADLSDDMPVTIELGWSSYGDAESTRIESMPSDDIRHYDEKLDVTTYQHVKSFVISAT